MAAETDTRPVIDRVAIAISPILVMGMVGSLVFFLIEVLYQGQYSDRLLYTFFFFVIGAVLIARITIEMGRARAGIYAGGLGLACFIAMMQFVEYPAGPMKILGPIINIMLMALVWWSANKLTWDCTHFDDARKASGRGILGAAGLDDTVSEDEDEPEETDKKKKKRAEELSWLERWEAYKAAQRKKPHTPGVWVLYFALAALPMIALGQSLIPVEDAARRSATFYDMAMYVACALGLLVTTSLMGLSRYLQDRGARIPPVLTMGWLGLGAGLIVMFLLVGAVLPRPHSETPLVDLTGGGKSDRAASKNAVVRDSSAGKGEGAEGKKTEAGQGKNSAKGGEQKGGNSGEKGSGSGKGKSQGGDQKGEKSGGKQGDQKGQKNDKSDGKDNKDKNDSKGPNSKDDKQGDKSGGKQESENAKQSEKSEQQDADSKDDSSSNQDSSSAMQNLSKAMETVSAFIKWVVWIIVAIAVIVGVIYFCLKGLAPFTNWAKNLLDWLKSLFGPKKPKSKATVNDEGQKVKGVLRPPPFVEFTNPFVGGSSRKRTTAELVEYTFSAFDSWAWDRGLGRAKHETPTEFAARVGHQYADIDDPGFATAELYQRVMYSQKPISKDAIQPLIDLWEMMESAAVTRTR